MNEFVCKLPRNFNESTMYDLILEVVNKDHTPKHKKIVFDFCDLNFIESSGITVLASTIGLLKSYNVKISFITPNPLTAPCKYLDDSMFFKQYLGSTKSEDAEVRPTTVQLQNVSHSESAFWLEEKFVKWLSHRLGVKPKVLSDFQVCMYEIFNNIIDHSGQKHGYIFIQHYPNKHEVFISISDFGMGIVRSLKSKYPDKDEAYIIREAVREGVSSKTIETNLGAGLDTLIKNAVLHNGGIVEIFSNGAGIICKKYKNNVNYNEFQANGYYPGTQLVIKLRTDTIMSEEETEEDFIW